MNIVPVQNYNYSFKSIHKPYSLQNRIFNIKNKSEQRGENLNAKEISELVGEDETRVANILSLKNLQDFYAPRISPETKTFESTVLSAYKDKVSLDTITKPSNEELAKSLNITPNLLYKTLAKYGLNRKSTPEEVERALKYLSSVKLEKI